MCMLACVFVNMHVVRIAGLVGVGKRVCEVWWWVFLVERVGVGWRGCDVGVWRERRVV